MSIWLGPPSSIRKMHDLALAAVPVARLSLHLQQGRKRKPAEQTGRPQTQHPPPGNTVAVTESRPTELMIEFHQ